MFCMTSSTTLLITNILSLALWYTRVAIDAFTLFLARGRHDQTIQTSLYTRSPSQFFPSMNSSFFIISLRLPPLNSSPPPCRNLNLRPQPLNRGLYLLSLPQGFRLRLRQ